MSTSPHDNTRSTSFESSQSYAHQMDADDELAVFRSRFLIPADDNGNEILYLVGHSLGLQPVTTRSAVEEELATWSELGVDGHFRGGRPWTRYHETVGPPMAEIVGARTDEIILMNALTVNLHLMMLTFYRPTRDRYKVVMEDHAFPSDRYAVASQVQLHGFDPSEAVITVAPRSGEHTLRTEDIVRTIKDAGNEVALVMFGGVNYYTGQYFDLPGIVAAAHEVGAVAGFDLAHAAGNVELRLHDWDVDFAVWCMYKYLNSGPGSLSGCFIHERQYTNRNLPRLAGWWGEDLDKRFEMAGEFQPAAGAAGWQISNPNV
ncbi:MAG: kynureninase, partial [Rhodothermia bacterium]|nr:kynureninase [Rhodothermia bacterium]